MIFIDAFFSFAAGGRHHLDGDAVIRQLRCGYSAAAPRLEGITLAVMRLFGNFVAVNWAAAPRLGAASLRLMPLASVL